MRFEWREDQLDLLRRAVGRIVWWADDDASVEPVPLVLDEFDEAWPLVFTPDGPGLLWWCNSD